MGDAIGILGGTFDPIHIGHLVHAEVARTQLGLARVFFAPAADPPHKPGRSIRPFEERCALVEAAISDNDGFALSRLDAGTGAPNYTVDLLERFQREFDGARLTFIVGADSLMELHTWHDPARIVQLASLAVAPRPGTTLDLDQVLSRTPELAGRLQVLDAPALDISATEIRERLDAGKSVRYLVPDSVWRLLRPNDGAELQYDR